MAAGGDHLHMVLVGKTGNGKSAVGNSILNQNAFASGSQTESITAQISTQTANINGRSVTVIDTPGLADTGSSSGEIEARRSVAEVDQVMHASPAGVDVFLLVVRFGARFTAEDKKCVQLLRSEFGQMMLNDYCVIVVTYGDLFEAGDSFDGWVAKQTGAFQELVTECRGRVVLFNNVSGDEHVRNEQVRLLLEKVDRLRADNAQSPKYTSANFAITAVDRMRIVVVAEEPTISAETMTEVSSISDELRKISQDESDNQIPDLQALLTRCQQLEEKLQTLDRGTGALSRAMNLAAPITVTVRNTIDTKVKAGEDKKRLELEQARMEREARDAFQREKEEMERRAEEERRARERRLREEEEERARQREEKERASRENQAALEAELERQRQETHRQEEALKAAQAQATRSPTLDRKVVREVNRVARQVRKFFR